MSHKIKKLINFSGFKRSFLWVVIGVEGDRGAGAREKRGGKREERGREAGFLRWRELGENK